MHARLVGGLMLVMLALPPLAAWSQTPDQRKISYGRHLAQECTSCHRIDGTDNGIPSIIGQDPAHFAETIGYYKTGARTNQVMVSVAQSLDDEQVAALAAYYASLPKAKK
jgi:cytochrome c553